MNTAHTVATFATPASLAALAAAVGYVARLLKSGRFDRVAAEVVKDAPAVETAVADVEQVPACKHLVEDLEAKAKAEAERLNAATHGAIDLLAGELAKAVPSAIQQAILAAHTAVAPVESAPAVDVAPEPAEVPAAPAEPVSEPSEPAPVVETVPAAGAPISTALHGSAPA